MFSHAQLNLTLRPARPEDERSLATLAALDSADPLEGDVIVAESGARPLAAIDVVTGRLIADPFTHTEHEADLLRARRSQIRRRPRRHFGRRLGLA